MGYRQTFGDAKLGPISGVASSLPAGFTLGEERSEDGIRYRLMYNAGNSEVYPGYGLMRAGSGAGPYSVTVTTVTESVNGMKGVVYHATLPTGNYGWVATYGHPVKMVASNISLATGAKVGPAATGKFVTTDTVANQVGENMGDAASATATTDATGSRFFINFEKVL